VYESGREQGVSKANNGGHPGGPLRAKEVDAQVLWEEYEYRHSLVWRVIIQITTAPVILSVVPYVADETIVRHLRWWILAAPALAFLLALFALLVINNELKVLDRIREAHRNQQRAILGLWRHTKDRESDGGFFRKLLQKLQKELSFRRLVEFYLLALSMLCFVNGVICMFRWVPHV
jgi:hypothetical protein